MMPGEALPDSRNWWRVAPAVAVLAWGGNQFTPLLLVYERLNGYTPLAVYLFLAAYVAGLAPALLYSGRLARRIGPRTAMAIALAVSVAASVGFILFPYSPVLMIASRVLSGVTVGVAMTVGTTWIRDLVTRGSATRRASMTITAGLGMGALASGVLASWAPLPTLLPYLIHIAITAIAIWVLFAGRICARSVGEPDTGAVIVSMPSWTLTAAIAPWVFGAGSVAYALVPALVVDRSSAIAPGFAALMTTVTLAVGTVVQPFVPCIARLTGGVPGAVGLALAAVGFGVSSLVAQTGSAWVALSAAVVLGASFGICLSAGLERVPKEAGSRRVGAFYSLTYVGFLLPALLAGLEPVASYTLLLVLVAALCVACSGLVFMGELRERAR